MSRSGDTRGFLDTHWTVPGELVGAAAGLWDPEGPDDDLLETLAQMLEDLGADAARLGLTGIPELADGLGALASGLAEGDLDPMGPAGGVLEAGATALEDAFLELESGQRHDAQAVTDHAHRAARAAGRDVPEPGQGTSSRPVDGQQPPAAPPGPEPTEAPEPAAPTAAPVPAAGPAPGSFPVERWGPWAPPYPDMEDDFLEEIQSAIDQLQSGIIGLSSGAVDEELVNALFRASHSIKGQSGQMAAQPLEKVAHKLEDVLDLVRQGELALSPSSTEALLGVIDALQAILEQIRETRCVEHPIAREIDLMDRISRGEDPVAAAAPPAAVPPAPEQPAPAASPEPARAPAPATSPAPPKKPPSKAAATPSRTQSQYLRVDFSKVDHVMNLVGDLFINKIKLHDGVGALDDLLLQVTRLQALVAQQRERGDEGIELDEEESRRLVGGIARLGSDIEGLADRLSAATGETDMISSDLRDQIMVMRMVPLDSLFSRLGRVVFDAVQKECRGHAAGWKQARLDVVGADAEIDKVIANMLEVPLVHIVRNAVAHGIEPAEERTRSGKPPEGTVQVQAGQQGAQFVIRVSDDGRGMVPAIIGQVAVSKGLLTEEELEGLSDKDILGLVFKPGFTTAEKADDLKGRGVGLDEVMSKINQVKGGIEVESEPGAGTTVTLSLPLTLAINTVLVGEVAGETLAIPMSAVERVVHVEEREVEHMGDTEVFTLLDKTVPLVRADEILAMGRPASQKPDSCYVVMLRVGVRRFGLAFDRMSGKQDVVVKSLGSLLVEAPLVAGATLLGERCILILDPVDIAANLGRAQVSGSRRSQGRGEKLRPRLLLVEDDATTRIHLRRIFEDAGLDVTEAADGAEGLETATRDAFQLVSTDIIMPRMDGYELTRRLRQLPAYSEVPIIMISSKSEEVDRRAGFEAGVDHYLVKPVDRGELIELVREVRL